MYRVIFFTVYAAMGVYLLFSVLQFRNAFLAASERTNASHWVRLEAEARLRERPYTLLFVGDIMLDRGVRRVMEREQDFLYPFLRIAEMTRSADFAFGNLESPISDRGERQNQSFAFRADPGVIHGLVYAGFDALSVANNHIFDYGREAYEDTMRRLSANGIASVTGDPRYFAFGDTRFAVVAYAPVLPSFDLDAALRTITNLLTSNIEPPTLLIVVSLHWGEEYQSVSNEYQRSIGRSLIDAGADLVIGHHPHVAQEVEKYKNGYIAYSLGNFIFDQNFSEETMRGLMLKVFVAGGKIVRVEEVPIKINAMFQPELAPLTP